MDHHLGPSQAEAPCLGGEGAFSVRIHTANDETDAEAETAQALFHGQRMEKRGLGSKINFSTRLGLRHRIYRRVEAKGRELSKEREKCT